MTQRSGIASSRPTPRLANSTHWFARHSVTTGQVAPKPCEAPRQLPVLALLSRIAKGSPRTRGSQLRPPQVRPEPQFAPFQEGRVRLVCSCGFTLSGVGHGSGGRSRLVLDRVPRCGIERSPNQAADSFATCSCLRRRSTCQRSCSWRPKPGKFMSWGFVAAFRVPRIRRNRSSCLA